MHMGVSTYIAVAYNYNGIVLTNGCIKFPLECSQLENVQPTVLIFLLERWQMVSFKLNGYIGLPKIIVLLIQ